MDPVNDEDLKKKKGGPGGTARKFNTCSAAQLKRFWEPGPWDQKKTNKKVPGFEIRRGTLPGAQGTPHNPPRKKKKTGSGFYKNPEWGGPMRKWQRALRAKNKNTGAIVGKTTKRPGENTWRESTAGEKNFVSLGDREIFSTFPGLRADVGPSVSVGNTKKKGVEGGAGFNPRAGRVHKKKKKKKQKHPLFAGRFCHGPLETPSQQKKSAIGVPVCFFFLFSPPGQGGGRSPPGGLFKLTGAGPRMGFFSGHGPKGAKVPFCPVDKKGKHGGGGKKPKKKLSIGGKKKTRVSSAKKNHHETRKKKRVGDHLVFLKFSWGRPFFKPPKKKPPSFWGGKRGLKKIF